MKNSFCNKIFLVLTLILSTFVAKAEDNENISGHKYDFYAGIFDTIDKEGDEKATLYGFEHNNPILFRDTFAGKFSPISGGFMTNKSSIYLYTGVQADYEIGTLNILPSFTPGYYAEGDGKNLGSPLEFKSEIKISFDIFKNSEIGYSYSHISNNDWGDINPGVDNQTISITKNF